MSLNSSAAFLSYSHDDNKNSHNGILVLANALQAEYELLTGETLKMFVDSEAIQWGDEWRSRIDNALTQTTFFIPVVTAKYFKRPECRREFQDFMGHAKSLGMESLVMPILYSDLPNLVSDSADELIAQVARTQYIDWRNLRLLNPDAAEYKTAIYSLARRLRDVGSSVTDAQIARELEVGDAAEDLGLAEVLERLTVLLPPWLEEVLSAKTTQAQMSATVYEYLERLKKLQKGGAPQSAIMSTQLRLGPRLVPLMEQALVESQAYLRLSIELDPLIITAARKLTLHPENGGMFGSVKETIWEAMEMIRKQDEVLRHRHEGGPDHFVMDHVTEIGHLSRTLGKVCAIHAEAVEFADQGNRMVRRWWGDLEPLIK